MNMYVLTVSSKGQIVLPIEIRKALSINTGDRLAVFASDDVIMLKAIRIPTEKDFKAKLDEAADWAKKVGYLESDLYNVIKEYRKTKNRR